jgi:hypothetical protein
MWHWVNWKTLTLESRDKGTRGKGARRKKPSKALTINSTE